MFLTHQTLAAASWQAFERNIARLLIHRGYGGVRVVGCTGDQGADILAEGPAGRRWLVQAKFWRKPVPKNEIRKTLDAARKYRAHCSVVVALNGFDEEARAFQRDAMLQGHAITLWSASDLVNQAAALPATHQILKPQGQYQSDAIDLIYNALQTGSPHRFVAVMATGLGKTFTAAAALQRYRATKPARTLVLAHTNALVLQLEKAFWKFLTPHETTAVWNENEKPDESLIQSVDFLFATRDSVANFIKSGGALPAFDVVLIDECHHAHSKSEAYQSIINHLHAGLDCGPALIGLTATPFLADPDADLRPVFGQTPLVCIDMVYGLRHGFLADIDYRLFTDNINWDSLNQFVGQALSPKAVNRAFFIQEWDDAVITHLQNTWQTVQNPKALVFCGTIDHALLVRDKINARGFCNAGAIFSGAARGEKMTQYDKNLMLADFEAGQFQALCTVDMFNEGIDVPDINIVVFNRVTHSRRIFIQQLGRGLRISAGKTKAIALDFAQDIRRYAAGIKLKDDLRKPMPGSIVSAGHKVEFRSSLGEDVRAETFLRAWLQDVERIEAAGDDDVGILKFPPALP
jgi:superfamily II DNA or RNA helicase/Holliday junction resolvase